jgi:hypothetical protein
MRKLNEGKVREIKTAWRDRSDTSKEAESQFITGLARAYGVSTLSVTDIVRGISWKHIQPARTQEQAMVESPEYHTEARAAAKLLGALMGYEETVHPNPYVDKAYAGTTPRIRSGMTGNYILPAADNKAFTTIWYALLEYKSMLEVNIAKMMKFPNGGSDEPWQGSYVNNTPGNLEDQAFLYRTITNVTELLNEYTERAQKIGLF